VTFRSCVGALTHAVWLFLYWILCLARNSPVLPRVTTTIASERVFSALILPMAPRNVPRFNSCSFYVKCKRSAARANRDLCGLRYHHFSILLRSRLSLNLFCSCQEGKYGEQTPLSRVLQTLVAILLNLSLLQLQTEDGVSGLRAGNQCFPCRRCPLRVHGLLPLERQLCTHWTARRS